MDYKKYFTTEVLKKIGETVIMDIVIPIAREYVSKTDNKYDDAAVEFIKDFAMDFLKTEVSNIDSKQG